LARKSSR